MSACPVLLESARPVPAAIRAALYLRVSTRADKRDDDAARQRKRQEVDNQRRQLHQFCEAQGWEIVAEYADEESGAKTNRAGFQQMWRDAAQRRFDVLLFWALDRFSREGVLETLNYLQRLTSYGIDWRSHTLSSTSTPPESSGMPLSRSLPPSRNRSASGSAREPAPGWTVHGRKEPERGDRSAGPALYYPATV